MDTEELEEPDVTPLINVNLVILVMVLAMAAHSARLLPLAMPKAPKTEFVDMAEATQLRVEDLYAVGGKSGLTRGQVEKAIITAVLGQQADRDRVKQVQGDLKPAMDAVIGPVEQGEVELAFMGRTFRITVDKGHYSLGDKADMDKFELADAIDALADDAIVLVHAEPTTEYGTLVAALDYIMARPKLRVAFGQPGQAPASVAPTGAPSGT